MATRAARRPVWPLALSVLLFGVAVLVGRSVARGMSPLHRLAGETKVSQAVVIEQTRAVARLVTSETMVRDVVTYENSRLGSTKRSLVVVTGKVLTRTGYAQAGPAAGTRATLCFFNTSGS